LKRNLFDKNNLEAMEEQVERLEKKWENGKRS
jgi:hypothetical protein